MSMPSTNPRSPGVVAVIIGKTFMYRKSVTMECHVIVQLGIFMYGGLGGVVD